MPTLRTRLRERGASFPNAVVPQPQCGPSRASILQGRYPHNVGYIGNSDARSVAAYRAVENDTVGTWLTSAGYHTGARARLGAAFAWARALTPARARSAPRGPSAAFLGARIRGSAPA